MSVIIKKIQRVNPQKRTEPKKWYPSLVTIEQMDEDEVSDAIADETTLNPGEALMAIRQLRKVIINAVLNGKSVRLGNWGSFYGTIDGKPAETKDTLTAENVAKLRVVFRPGKEFKEALEKATFTWTESLEGIKPEEDDEEEEGGGNDDGPTVQ